VRRALAAIAAVGGVFALLAGSPYRVDVDRMAAAIAHEDDHVTALELATWIRDRKPGLRVVDLRKPAEFDEYHLPRAENVAIENLASTPFTASETIVLISDGGAHAAQGWVLLQAMGHRQVFFLRGGLQEWLDDVMSPTTPEAAAIGRYFGGVPRVGAGFSRPVPAKAGTNTRRGGC
jgi:rhodanese-related sulfurtransferase